MKGTMAVAALTMLWGTTAGPTEIAPAAHDGESAWSSVRAPSVEIEAVARVLDAGAKLGAIEMIP